MALSLKHFNKFFSYSPPPPPPPPAQQSVVDRGFQYNLPLCPTVPDKCVPFFSLPLYLNPLRRHPSIFYVVFLFSLFLPL